jgi:hypothetical protein
LSIDSKGSLPDLESTSKPSVTSDLTVSKKEMKTTGQAKKLDNENDKPKNTNKKRENSIKQ